MLVCFRSRVRLEFGGRNSTTTFYWMSDLPLGHNYFSYAQEINDQLIFGSPWFNLFQALITEQALIKTISTRPFRPATGANAIYQFPGSGIIGGWPFEAGDYFTGVFLSWHGDNDFTGKHGVRIGPIGSGATGSGGWNPLFNTACFNFEGLCAAIFPTTSGFDFRGCIVDKLGLFTPITGAQIHWPPCRQIQRRRIL